jgi:hypothetical protein
MQAQRLAQSLDPCVSLTVEVDGEVETAVEPLTAPAPVVAASHA